MKVFIYAAFSLLLFSCNASKKSAIENNKKDKMPEQVAIVSGCPTDGECTSELMDGKKIVFEKEESTGMMYPKFPEELTEKVVKFEYNRKTDPRVMDASYREEVYFEMPSQNGTWKDKELQELKMVYGRFCFCDKDSVGYFKVDNGTLTKDDNGITLSFENEQGPKVIKEITFSF